MKKFSFFAFSMILCILSSAALADGDGSASFFSDYEGTSYYSSVAGLSGSLYALKNDGLYTYKEGKEILVSAEVLSDYQVSTSYERLLSDEAGLYGFRSDTRVLTRILNADSQPVSETYVLPEGEYPRDVLLQDGVIYTLESVDGQGILRGMNLETKAESETPVENDSIVSLAAYRDGKALALTNRRTEKGFVSGVSVLDLQTGKLAELCAPAERAYLAAYQKATDTIYLASRAAVYSYRVGDKEPTLSAYVLSGDTVAFAVENDMAAVIVDSSFALRKLGSAASQSALTFCRQFGRSEEYKNFLSANPNINLVFINDSTQTTEEKFIQDMTTRNDQADIYMLTDTNLIASIYQKNYGVDLAADADIKALVESMYEPFRSVFERNGAVYVFPESAWMNMLGCRTEFFEHFGLPLPTTYDELFDQTQLWIDDYAADNPTAQYSPFSNDVDISHILTRYADECAANGKPIVYNTPEIATMLQKYLDVYAAYQNAPVPSGGGLYAYNLIYVPTNSFYSYVPLAVRKGNTPVISTADIVLNYLVINPYSKHQKEALAFVKSIAEGWSSTMRLIFTTAVTEPVENSEYQRQIAEIEKERAELQKAGDTPEIKALLESLDTRAKSIEEYRYEVTAEEISWYNENVSKVTISDFNPMKVLIESQPELFAQLASGAMDVRHFLAILDNRIDLIMKENE